MIVLKNLIFSIVIPCYNEESFITTLLVSLESQNIDLQLFEVIVVDNNSADYTAQAVWNYAKDSNLDLKMVHEYEQGVSIARNSGASIAKGDTIIFLDADNTVPTDFLSQLINYKTRNSINAGSICTLPDNRAPAGWFVFMTLEVIKTLSPKPFGKSFVDRNIYDLSFGFNDDIALGENVEFLQNVKKIVKNNGGKFGHFRPGIKCSLRRFEKAGYSPVLMQWFLAYIGIYNLDYTPMSEFDDKQ